MSFVPFPLWVPLWWWAGCAHVLAALYGRRGA